MDRGGRFQTHRIADLADRGRIALLRQRLGDVIVDLLLHFCHLRHMPLPLFCPHLYDYCQYTIPLRKLQHLF